MYTYTRQAEALLHHSFTLSLQAQNLPFQQIFPTLGLILLPLGCIHDYGTGPDLSCFSSGFILLRFSLIFLFVPSRVVD